MPIGDVSEITARCLFSLATSIHVCEFKAHALVGSVSYREIPPMRLRNPIDNCEPESSAFLLGCKARL